MTVILTDFGYAQHTHQPGEEYAHYDCRFRANGRPATITVAVQARLVANGWFPLIEFLREACCERVQGWYNEPADVRWG